MENNKQSKSERNKEDHFFTHFLLMLILIINLVTLYLTYSNYLSHQYVIDEMNGIHHPRVITVDD